MTNSIIDGLDTWWIIPDIVLGGEYPGDVKGTGAKLESLLDFGIGAVFNLTSKEDNLTPYVFTEHNMKGYVLYQMPIPDGGVISLDSYRKCIDHIRDETERGRKVYIHCWGGRGRTSTVAGCLLAATTTLSPEDIFARIDKSRRESSAKADLPAPENEKQRQIVRDYYHKYGTWGSDA